MLAQSDRNQDNGFSIEGASSALSGRGSTGRENWEVLTTGEEKTKSVLKRVSQKSVLKKCLKRVSQKVSVKKYP